ncbi:diguanylate cyclase [Shewanella sp. MM_2022_3]|uniref:sensor domain-containing diguanylate cyclase n=1 Tax=Shewanella sp. MM_2022_3 TaxID=2923280 RepID=UPI001F4C1840|nr:diguanylate cyclase [Shewanella sp. MM_2022_3]MCH7423464.1 diguanylate cyclase [Shewanella sp. MM_2022_3]
MLLPSFNASHLKLATLLGLLGLVINIFPIPLFANVQLILGNAAVVIVAILLGPWYALYTALFTATGLMLAWSSSHVYVVFLLEALWLGFARRKDVPILYASIGYWLLVGVPLISLYLWLITGLPNYHIPFTTVKQAVNGILYATIGELCVVALPSLWHLKDKIVNHTRRTFSAQLSYLFILITTITLLTSSLMFNQYFMDKQQDLINKNLNDTGIFLGHATETYLSSNTSTVASIGKFLSISGAPFDQWQLILESVQSLKHSFTAMFIVNTHGEIVAGSPLDKLKKIAQKINVQDRDFFIQALTHHNTFVSPVFVARGPDQEIVIAISTPIFKEDSNTAIGIVQGNLDLSYFSSIDNQNQHHETQSIILLDEKKNIVYSSERLRLTPLTPFNFKTGSTEYRTRLKLMDINLQEEADPPEYIYAHHQLNNGWHLYVLEPFIPLLTLAQKQYFNTVGLLLISMVAAMIIAKVISRLTTTPLALLAQHFSQTKDGSFNEEKFEHGLLDNSTPQEIYSLYESLEAKQQALLNNQLELEDKVKQRTMALEIANRKLKDMAERDPLTNLYNRRYAEKQFLHIQHLSERSKDTIAVVLLDLDFFKKVNDTYGHLAGDECLRVMAEVLSNHFKRDVDLLCRYGGEEFALVLPMCNASKVEQHLNAFKEKLSSVVITNPTDQVTFSVTVSIGAIIADAAYSAKLDDWLKEADENLYKAKEQGRNCVVCTLITS